ncbi:uncharacterized protein [Drosophila bipectinata]|uniref:uncharacterized protein isoform X2 n=1 Tax=Drosophila bipectinata TaxID=42026 RepID=UPI001C8AB961|nr:uncharacterized protein LOC108127933 isoform X2 [Drosophila bipectinata]
MDGEDTDWQNCLVEIKDRGQYLLRSEKWADCRFLVGTPPNQQLVAAHKLLLAMASPVFETMFFGNLPDKTDPIVISDVQPEAFEALLEYIYTDRIHITSFDKACELCYVAKKYMLPHVVTRCTHFLWADLSPKNACRAYEFAKLFDEPRLMQSSMDLIAANTREVLSDPSFLDIEVPTLMAILDQNRLNIDSELDLFNCLLKFANERGMLNESGQEDDASGGEATGEGGHVLVEEIKMEPDVAAMVQHMHQDEEGESSFESDPFSQPSTSAAGTGMAASAAEAAGSSASAASPPVNVEIDVAAAAAAASDDVVIIDSDASGDAAANMINLMDAQRTILDGAMLRQAVKKIRFLTMTPKQFAEGPARSKLLQQHEALAILIKISSPTLNDCRMPEGFCVSRSMRNYYEPGLRMGNRELGSAYRHPSTVVTSGICFSGAGPSIRSGGCPIMMSNSQPAYPRMGPAFGFGFGDEQQLGIRAPDQMGVPEPAPLPTGMRCFGDAYEGGPVGPPLPPNENEPSAGPVPALGGPGAAPSVRFPQHERYGCWRNLSSRHQYLDFRRPGTYEGAVWGNDVGRVHGTLHGGVIRPYSGYARFADHLHPLYGPCPIRFAAGPHF